MLGFLSDQKPESLEKPANPDPFVGVFISEDNAASCRLPVPLNSIHSIQSKCFEVNESQRWLLSIISDIGMRLSKAAGRPPWAKGNQRYHGESRGKIR